MIKDKMAQLELNQKIHYTLRIASAMCFIGHGSFGIITKPIWCNYFAVFGVGHDLSYQLMPLVEFRVYNPFVFTIIFIPIYWGIFTVHCENRVLYVPLCLIVNTN